MIDAEVYMETALKRSKPYKSDPAAGGTRAESYGETALKRPKPYNLRHVAHSKGKGDLYGN